MIYVSPSAETDPATLPKGESKAVGTKRICILVLGMHRSGTSMLVRTLTLLGAALPTSIVPPDANNPAGYWEPELLNILNDEMLIEAGSRWDDWRPFNHAALPIGRDEYYRAEITRIIGQEYGDAPLFVLKEPRITRFVPALCGYPRDHGYRRPLRAGDAQSA